MIVFERRPQPSRLWAYLTPPVAVVATMIAGGLLFWGLGKDPLVALRTIFWDPLFGEFAFYYRQQLLVKAGPLILIATGLALGFQAGVWNIGAEGQYIVGALCAAAVALSVYPGAPVMVSLPGWLGGADLFTWSLALEARWIVFPAMVIAGAIGGALWALIPGFLKVRFGTNEILVSLMLVYVAENLLSWASIGLLRNPEGMGFPGSRDLSRWAPSANRELIAGTGMHWGLVAAFITVIFAYVMLSRHLLGFHIRLAGQAPRAAAFGGVNPGRLILICMGLAGALAGLAGMFEVAGPAGKISIDFNVGYGFTAIIVAFLGRLHPLGIAAAGLLLALTYIGGETAQQSLGLPVAAIQIFQGMLLFFLLAFDIMTNFRPRLRRRTVALGKS